MKKIEEIKKYLNENNVDAYIMVDYENRNKVLLPFIGTKPLTRKIFLIIDKKKKPYFICHQIDSIFLEEFKEVFDIKIYKTRGEMLALENKYFSEYKNVLMDISENGLIQSISLVDYGTVEYIKNLNINIISSGNLITYLKAYISDEDFKNQEKVCNLLLQIKDEAFRLIKQDIINKGFSNEYRIQNFIVSRFNDYDLFYDDPPIVAINNNASNPHYAPTKEINADIHINDIVLIDMWAKSKGAGSVYGDITWMGYVGEDIPLELVKRFNVLKKAVDKGIDYIKGNINNKNIYGYEIDDIIRNEIKNQGFGEFFTHRTGHSIAKDVSPHGSGTNIDNYETHDDRLIKENMSFSIEPGIYMDDFGIRLETDVFIDSKRNVIVVGSRQNSIIEILKL